MALDIGIDGAADVCGKGSLMISSNISDYNLFARPNFHRRSDFWQTPAMIARWTSVET